MTHSQKCVRQLSLQWLQATAQHFEGGQRGSHKPGTVHGLNQPSERNERGHVYEEVITRGNRAGCFVSVCVLVEVVGAGGKRSSGIVGTNGGVSLFPPRL